MTPVIPVTFTDALLLLLLGFCDICSSSLSLSFESLDSNLFQIFITTFKMEDQRSIITCQTIYYCDNIISLIISTIITEERGKTIDIIFIDIKYNNLQ